MLIQEHVALKKYSTLHIGGTADFFCIVKTRDELAEVTQWALQKKITFMVIGEGSNMLFSDQGYRGLIIKNEIKGISTETRDGGTYLSAGAGELLDDVVAYACERGVWGMENFSSIPGTAGAAPVQNVGAYGVEMKDVVHTVLVYDPLQNSFKTLTQAQCLFAYRHSYFKEVEGKHLIIVSVSFFLSTSGKPRVDYRDVAEYVASLGGAALTPSIVRAGIITIRSNKFPDWHTVGTLGSFFKNPVIDAAHFASLVELFPNIVGHTTDRGMVKVHLAWILDHVCHMRGVREGAVGTYDRQALVVVNYGNATAKEIILFAKKIADVVKEKTNINIEWEVTYVQ